MAEARPQTMTVDQFYRWQLDQDERYELVDGLPVPLRGMTGASNAHDVILVNCIIELGSRLRGKPCRVTSADTALRTAIRTTRRPDVTVDCSDPQDKSFESQRPTVVFEVLSPSTRKIDQFKKLDEYRRHPTLRHIVLIDPDLMSARHYSRPGEEPWADADLGGPDAIIELTAIDVALPLGLLYDRLDRSA
jgi:Uma2 family endonuclease